MYKSFVKEKLVTKECEIKKKDDKRKQNSKKSKRQNSTKYKEGGAYLVFFWSLRFNLQIHIKFFIVSSMHIRHPWRWQFCVCHCQCMWQHFLWHSFKSPSIRLFSLHRQDLTIAWHHHVSLDDVWPALWCLVCCFTIYILRSCENILHF